MPYVPSKKTVPPAEDREILDPLIRTLAEETAEDITDNSLLIRVYQDTFFRVVDKLYGMLNGITLSPTTSAAKLAKAIYDLGQKYNYYGAYEGELNYSVTMFIQWVPEIKVKNGEWKEPDELRYWLYGATVKTLIWISYETKDWDNAISGVFEDIKDEYKYEVNRPYEVAQMLKSGHCYFTPYYMRVAEVVDEDGKVVGHLEIPLKRSEETLHQDLLDWQIVVRKRPSQ